MADGETTSIDASAQTADGGRRPWLLLRAAGVFATLLLGLTPSVLFFIWVDALGRDPGFAILIPWILTGGPAAGLGAPIVDLGNWPKLGRVAVDLALIAGFGALHTGLAQVGPQEVLARFVGRWPVRGLYVISVGLSLCVVMVLWQPLGGIVWQIGPSSNFAERIGQGLYWGFIVVMMAVIAGPGALEFVGLRPMARGESAEERTAGTPRLVTNRVYAFVRHPGYLFLLLSLLSANRMTADRLAVFAGVLGYLAIGIPIEERKLIALFGAAYEEYRARVPALLPFGRGRTRG